MADNTEIIKILLEYVDPKKVAELKALLNSRTVTYNVKWTSPDLNPLIKQSQLLEAALKRAFDPKAVNDYSNLTSKVLAKEYELAQKLETLRKTNAATFQRSLTAKTEQTIASRREVSQDKNDRINFEFDRQRQQNLRKQQQFELEFYAKRQDLQDRGFKQQSLSQFTQIRAAETFKQIKSRLGSGGGPPGGGPPGGGPPGGGPPGGGGKPPKGFIFQSLDEARDGIANSIIQDAEKAAVSAFEANKQRQKLRDLNQKDARGFGAFSSSGAKRELGFAALFGGPAGFAGGVAGGLAGGRDNIFLGATAGQLIAGAFGAAFDKVKETLLSVAEAGLIFQRSILGISAIYAATSKVVGPDGKEVPFQQGLTFQLERAREVQLESRKRLLPLGIGGETEATIVQSIVTGAAGRGLTLSAKGTATIAERLGAFAAVLGLTNNPNLLQRDIRDILAKSPAAKRTTLGSTLVGITPELFTNRANTEEGLLKATEKLNEAVLALKNNSDSAAISILKFSGGVDNLKTVFGDAFLTGLKPGIDELNKRLQNPETESGGTDLFRALGNAGSGIVKFGSGILGGLSTNNLAEILESQADQALLSGNPIGAAAIGFASEKLREAQEQRQEQILRDKRKQNEDQFKGIQFVPRNLIKAELSKIPKFQESELSYLTDVADNPEKRLEIIQNILGIPGENDVRGFYTSEKATQLKKQNLNSLADLDIARFPDQQKFFASRLTSINGELSVLQEGKAQTKDLDQQRALIVDINEKLKERKELERSIADATQSQIQSIRSVRDAQEALIRGLQRLPFQERANARATAETRLDIKELPGKKRLNALEGEDLELSKRSLILNSDELGVQLEQNILSQKSLIINQNALGRQAGLLRDSMMKAIRSVDSAFGSLDDQILATAQELKEAGGSISPELDLTDEQKAERRKGRLQQSLNDLERQAGRTDLNRLVGRLPGQITNQTNSPQAREQQEAIAQSRDAIALNALAYKGSTLQLRAIQIAYYNLLISLEKLPHDYERLQISVETNANNTIRLASQEEALVDRLKELALDLADLPLRVRGLKETLEDTIKKFQLLGGDLDQVFKALFNKDPINNVDPSKGAASTKNPAKKETKQEQLDRLRKEHEEKYGVDPNNAGDSGGSKTEKDEDSVYKKLKKLRQIPGQGILSPMMGGPIGIDMSRLTQKGTDEYLHDILKELQLIRKCVCTYNGGGITKTGACTDCAGSTSQSETGSSSSGGSESSKGRGTFSISDKDKFSGARPIGFNDLPVGNISGWGTPADGDTILDDMYGYNPRGFEGLPPGGIYLSGRGADGKPVNRLSVPEGGKFGDIPPEMQNPDLFNYDETGFNFTAYKDALKGGVSTDDAYGPFKPWPFKKMTPKHDSSYDKKKVLLKGLMQQSVFTGDPSTSSSTDLGNLLKNKYQKEGWDVLPEGSGGGWIPEEQDWSKKDASKWLFTPQVPKVGKPPSLQGGINMDMGGFKYSDKLPPVPKELRPGSIFDPERLNKSGNDPNTAILSDIKNYLNPATQGATLKQAFQAAMSSELSAGGVG